MRIFLRTLHEQVQVVRHEAVRKYCELTLVARLQDLMQNEVDGPAPFEQPPPAERAERQEIDEEPDVVESSEALRACHGAGVQSTVRAG